MYFSERLSRRIVCLLLVVCMFVGLVPGVGLAIESGAETTSVVVAETVSIVPHQSLAPPAAISQIFPDARLANEVARALGHSWTTGCIATQEDLNAITELRVFWSFGGPPTVGSLEGVQYLTALTSLWVQGSGLSYQIQDISPLSGLVNLQTLSLSRNQISDLTPLAELTNLQWISLNENQISDISPLAQLKSLSRLELRVNQISDISPLATLTNLNNLYMSWNQVRDISPLANLSGLSIVHLMNNQISDITPLPALLNGYALLQGQNIALEPVFLTNPLVIPNIVRSIDGSLAPEKISDNGAYENGIITWENLEAQETVSYSWHKDTSPIVEGPSYSTPSLESAPHDSDDWGWISFSGTITIPLVAPPLFPDVPDDHWARASILDTHERGIIHGDDAGNFNPGGMLTRAEAAVMLYRVAEEPAVTFVPIFSDVAAGRWYSDAVTWASERGIVRGLGDGRFAPDVPITRQEMATILHRFAIYLSQNMAVSSGSTLDFPDAYQISDWASEAKHWAVYNGLFQGTDEGLLLPLGTANRAEAAVLLMRFIAGLNTDFILTISVAEITLPQGENFRVDVELRNNSGKDHEITYFHLFQSQILSCDSIRVAKYPPLPQIVFFEADSIIRAGWYVGTALEPGTHELRFRAAFWLNWGQDNQQWIEVWSNTIMLTVQ